MKKLSEKQIIQENKYDFPYHYIPTWDGFTFSQTKNLAWGYEYLSYIHFVLDKVVQIGFESLLDVGCGDGRFLFELSQGNAHNQLVGLDFSQAAIDFAKVLMRDTKVELVCGDISDTNLFDQKFDIITLIETLEHIEFKEIQTLLKGIHNYLKEDGSFIISVPSKNMKLYKAHYQHFDLNILENVLAPFFTITNVNYINHKSTLLLKILKKILSNQFFIVNHTETLRRFYSFYIKNLLVTDSNNGRRIVVVCKRIS